MAVISYHRQTWVCFKYLRLLRAAALRHWTLTLMAILRACSMTSYKRTTDTVHLLQADQELRRLNWEPTGKEPWVKSRIWRTFTTTTTTIREGYKHFNVYVSFTVRSAVKFVTTNILFKPVMKKITNSSGFWLNRITYLQCSLFVDNWCRRMKRINLILWLIIFVICQNKTFKENYIVVW